MHEALGVARGEAEVLFGGPGGQVLRVRAGDVVVVPAGVGHCNQSQSADLLIVGAYPAAAPSPDLHRGDAGEHEPAKRAIATVPVPVEDPRIRCAVREVRCRSFGVSDRAELRTKRGYAHRN